MLGFKRSPKIVVQETAEGPLTTMVCPYCQVMIHPQTLKCVCCGKGFARQKAPRSWGFLDLLRRTGVPAAREPAKPEPVKKRLEDVPPPERTEAGPAETRAWIPPPASRPPRPQQRSGDLFETIFSVLGATRRPPTESAASQKDDPDRSKRPPR